MKVRYKAIPAVFLFLKKGNKILLQRRFNTGYEDGKYTFVSGHVEDGETPTQAIIREAKEEVGITIKSEDLEFLHLMYRKGTDSARTDICFTISKWEGNPQNMEPDKCDDVGWFELDKLPEVIDFVTWFLQNFREKKVYSEFGWE